MPYQLSGGSYDGPLFWVPAAPWTEVTDSDEAVSHLVSTFLTVVNPYWRYLIRIPIWNILLDVQAMR